MQTAMQSAALSPHSLSAWTSHSHTFDLQYFSTDVRIEYPETTPRRAMTETPPTLRRW